MPMKDIDTINELITKFESGDLSRSDLETTRDDDIGKMARILNGTSDVEEEIEGL